VGVWGVFGGECVGGGGWVGGGGGGGGGFRFSCLVSRLFTVIQLMYVKYFAKYFALRRRSGTCSVLNSFAAE